MAKVSKMVSALRREVSALRQSMSIVGSQAATIGQAAKMLNRSERTLRRLLADEQVPVLRVRGVLLIPMSEVKRLATPVVRASVSAIEKVAKARALFSKRRPRRETPSTQTDARRRKPKRIERHPQD